MGGALPGVAGVGVIGLLLGPVIGADTGAVELPVILVEQDHFSYFSFNAFSLSSSDMLDGSALSLSESEQLLSVTDSVLGRAFSAFSEAGLAINSSPSLGS